MNSHVNSFDEYLIFKMNGAEKTRVYIIFLRNKFTCPSVALIHSSLENMSSACFLTYIFLTIIFRNYSIDIAALISPKLNVPSSNNQISYYIIIQIIHLHLVKKEHLHYFNISNYSSQFFVTSSTRIFTSFKAAFTTVIEIHTSTKMGIKMSELIRRDGQKFYKCSCSSKELREKMGTLVR